MEKALHRHMADDMDTTVSLMSKHIYVDPDVIDRSWEKIKKSFINIAGR